MDFLINNIGQIGVAGVLAIFLNLIWKHHIKTIEKHREDLKEIIESNRQVISKNTEAMTELKDELKDLQIRL